MSNVESTSRRAAKDDVIEVDLRNPATAAVWAWLWPGAGHLYQRRYAKGVLFMACILGTYLFGLELGDGRVVYAAWQRSHHRWQYICQLGVGAPSLPALVQSYRVRNHQEPFWGGWMAPPRHIGPANTEDDLARLHARYHAYFELGTLYTMIAGLLNVLAIYDAYAGPVVAPVEEDEKERAPPGKQPSGGG